jgi:O-antigen/teichoic acid export membrane protein
MFMYGAIIKENRGTLILAGGTITATLISMVSAVVLPRFFTPDLLGQYGYWLDIFSILVLIFAFGAHGAVIRYLPIVKQGGELSLLFRLGIVKVFLLMAMVAAVLALPYRGGIGFWGILTAAFLASLAEVVRSFHYMKEHFFLYASYPNVLRFLRLALVLWLGTRLSGVVIPWLIIIPVLIGFPVLLPGLSFSLISNRGDTIVTIRELLRESIWLWLSGVLLMGMAWSVTPLARWLRIDWDTIGQLTVANRFVVLTVASLGAAHIQATFPRLSLSRTQESVNTTKKLFEESIAKTNLVLVPLTVLLWYLIPRWLPLIIGKSYAEAAVMTRYLAPIVLFFVWHLAFTRLLVIDGRFRTLFFSRAIGFGIYLVLTLFLTPRFGVRGIMSALLTGYFVYALSSLGLVVDDISFRSLKRCFFLPLAAGSLMVGVLLLPLNDPTIQTMVVLGTLVGYIGMIWLGRSS